MGLAGAAPGCDRGCRSAVRRVPAPTASPSRRSLARLEPAGPEPDRERGGYDAVGESDGHYLSVGQSALAAIERALAGAEPRNILDLPCGFGRVTRALRARFPHAAITVSDLDVAGVDFSAREFGARAAYSVRDFRELDLGEAYDLIWVGSLMTHLPAAQTKHLLSALRRHLSPGGIALVTLHGPSIIPRLRETGYGLLRGRRSGNRGIRTQSASDTATIRVGRICMACR